MKACWTSAIVGLLVSLSGCCRWCDPAPSYPYPQPTYYQQPCTPQPCVPATASVPCTPVTVQSAPMTSAPVNRGTGTTYVTPPR